MMPPPTRPATVSDRTIASVGRVAAPAAPVAVAKQPEATATTTVAAQMAASPPVDGDRVQRIKKAIAEGNFPLSPSTIADQLIALRYDWMQNDAA